MGGNAIPGWGIDWTTAPAYVPGYNDEAVPLKILTKKWSLNAKEIEKWR